VVRKLQGPFWVYCVVHAHLSVWIAALLLALIDLPDFGTHERTKGGSGCGAARKIQAECRKGAERLKERGRARCLS
jgi:hypothetical protein